MDADVAEGRAEKRPRRESPNTNGDEQAYATVAAVASEKVEEGCGVVYKIILANLAYDIKDEQVRDFFERRHGLNVDSVKLLGVNPTNASMCNGNAFVTFKDEESASRAESLDRSWIHGRDVRIFSTRSGHPRTACVRGMRVGSTERDVRTLFEGCGIRDIRHAPHRGGGDGNEPMTWFVDFEDDTSFEKALTFDRTQTGLFICVATAPSGNRTPREPREFRDSWRREERRDGRFGKRSRSPPHSRHRDSERYRGWGDDRRDRRDSGRRDRDFDRRDPDRRSHGLRDNDRHEDRRDRNDTERRVPDRTNLYNLDRHDMDGRNRNQERDPYAMYSADPDQAAPRTEEKNGPGSVSRSPARSRSPYRDDSRRRSRSKEKSRGADQDNDLSRSRDREESEGRTRRRESDVDVEPRRESRYTRSRNSTGIREMNGEFRDKVDDWSGRDNDRRNKDDDRDYRGRSRDRVRERGRDRDRDRGRDRRDRDFDRPRDRNEGEYGRRVIPQSTIEAQIEHADRFYEKDLVEDLTVIITNLPFADNREMAEREIMALIHTIEGVRALRAYPIGRRCGSCFVVLKDRESYDTTLRRRAMTFHGRNIHLYPLESPYTVRLHRLVQGFDPERVIEDLRFDFRVSGMSVSSAAADNMFLEMDSLRYLVHLLAVDGFPHRNGRLLSVSYCLPRRSLSNGSSLRRMSRDFDEDGGRGKDNHRSGARDDSRGGFGSSRDRDNKSDRDADGDRGRSHRDSGTRRAAEWRVRLLDVPGNVDEEVVYSFLSENGIHGVKLSHISMGTYVVQGRETDESMREATKQLNEKIFKSEKFGVEGQVCHTEALSPRPLPLRIDGDLASSLAAAAQDYVAGKRRDRPEDDEQPRASKKMRQAAYNISPLTPSPSNPSGKLVMPDPSLPEVTARMKRMKNKIVEDTQVIDSTDLAVLCDNLEKFCAPQELHHTNKVDDDIPVPHVWSGMVVKGRGAKAKCDGYVILREDQPDEDVLRSIKMLPKELNIVHRVAKDDPGFEHLLSPKSVAFIVRINEDESNILMNMSGEERCKRKPTSRAILIDILQSLREKRRLGLVRYTLAEEKGRFAALCIPPETDAFERLGIPWRFRELILHDSMMMVVGRKATVAMLQKKHGNE